MQGITGLILAGGRGERLGGVDKGWVEYRGRPLIRHAVDRLAPQVESVLISANRNIERYARVADVVTDDDAGVQLEAFSGPMLGVLSGLRRATNACIAIVPCDAPYFPVDLVQRLHLALGVKDKATHARVGSVMQPAFALIRSSAAVSLAAALMAGERALHRWLASIDSVPVDFHDEHAFANINTLADLA